ncbi:MAG: hypothetical protein ACREL7_03255 [Longimicrobiales bacterium]
MKDLEAVRRVRAKHEAALLRLPGVIGVGVGEKRTAGRKTGVLAIQVFVRRKRDVAGSDAVPAELDGVPTDVIERTIEPHGA